MSTQLNFNEKSKSIKINGFSYVFLETSFGIEEKTRIQLVEAEKKNFRD